MTEQVETAAQLDVAIDTLLQGSPAPVLPEDGELVTTARLLRGALPRMHPRFGFEELLAARLAAAGRAAHAGSAAAVTVLREPTPLRPSADLEVAPANSLEAPPANGFDAAARRRLLAGGAIASGVSLALPIAGAALVVWRRSRSSGGLL